MGYIGNSIMSFYQQIQPRMETANIPHNNVSIRIKVCDELFHSSFVATQGFRIKTYKQSGFFFYWSRRLDSWLQAI